MLQHKFRIKAKDTDFTQRIHYSAIFRYFEEADYKFFDHIGVSYKSLYAEGYGTPRVRVECDYLGAMRFEDDIVCDIAISRIGNTSFTYAFDFFSGDNRVARGSMTIVFIDQTTERPVPIPDFVRKKLEAYVAETTS